MIDYILGRKAKHEVFCKKCNQYVDYNTMTGHVFCIECREMLGFILDAQRVVFTWSDEETPENVLPVTEVIDRTLYACIPQKQRWLITV